MRKPQFGGNMTFEEKKEAYAELIVKMGAAVRKGQKVVVSCPVESYDFCRMVVRKAYEAGAEDVILKWTDDICSRMEYEYAPMSVFENFPEWTALERNTLAKNDAAFIHLTGSDPESLKGVDTAKVKAYYVAADAALKDYYHLQTTMGFKWTIAGVPTHAWAKKVFPELQEDVAVTKLWNAVFNTVRIGDGNAADAWMEHAKKLAEKAKKLTEWQFKSLHYENSIGTDFTVGLVKNHIWEGGADKDRVNGAPFFANMPTEEVFTMPDRLMAEGTLVASLPLSENGNLIENFTLKFKRGEVIDYSAEKGLETLKMILETDEGSRHLGECALVPYPAPVAEQGILFLDTLYDENAACHFALGACYETNLQGGAEMSEDELHAHGGNTSINHVDFMVGTKDLKITGTRWNGEKITVFENGKWAF